MIRSRRAVLVSDVTAAPQPGDVEAFRKAAKQSEHSVLLLVYRDGATLFMSLNR